MRVDVLHLSVSTFQKKRGGLILLQGTLEGQGREARGGAEARRVGTAVQLKFLVHALEQCGHVLAEQRMVRGGFLRG